MSDSPTSERWLHGEVLRLEREIRGLEQDKLSLQAERDRLRLELESMRESHAANVAQGLSWHSELTVARAEIKRLKGHLWDED